MIPLKEISFSCLRPHSDVQTQTLVYLPAIELLPVDFPQTFAVLSTFRFSLLPDHPTLVNLEEWRWRNHDSMGNLSCRRFINVLSIFLIFFCSPVQGFPVKNSSCKWMFSFKLSTLVNSPMKFNVRSSFCNDSQPARFSILSMLFIARFTYSSFFNLWRFSACKEIG